MNSGETEVARGRHRITPPLDTLLPGRDSSTANFETVAAKLQAAWVLRDGGAMDEGPRVAPVAPVEPVAPVAPVEYGSACRRVAAPYSTRDSPETPRGPRP